VSAGFFVLIAAKSIGSATHLKLGHWPRPGGFAVIAGGVVGVLIMSLFLTRYASHLSGFDELVKRILGGTLIAASIGGIVSVFRPLGDPDAPRRVPSPLVLALAGAIVGALVCLTSAGSGALLLLLLIPATHWRVAELAAVSNLFGLTTGAVSLAAYSRMTHLDWTLFLKVGIGILPGVLAGVWLSRRIERRWFLISFDILALALGASLLFRS
jgi:uncharacterized membrane protein YfcA